MHISLETFLRRLRDPRWIPHISSYCDGRCNRCSFTERCWSYGLRLHSENEEAAEAALPEAAPAVAIDLNTIQPDASDIRACEELQKKIDNDWLVIRAGDYERDTWKVMRSLSASPCVGESLAAGVAEAVDEVQGLALTIAAKVHRAVSSCAYERDKEFETDAVQNDANGSAKVARLAIAQSLVAWEVVRRTEVMEAWLAEYMIASLTQVEEELSRRLPLALAFVRPGFDEQIPGLVRPWSLTPDEDEEGEDKEGEIS